MTNVPISADGSFFGPHLRRGGTFTVGNKYGEQKFTEFSAALSFLREQPRARWRRPNANNNWGIVTATDWVVAPQSTCEIKS